MSSGALIALRPPAAGHPNRALRARRRRALIMASATLASKERSTHPAASEARASQNRAYTVLLSTEMLWPWIEAEAMLRLSPRSWHFLRTALGDSRARRRATMAHDQTALQGSRLTRTEGEGR